MHSYFWMDVNYAKNDFFLLFVYQQKITGPFLLANPWSLVFSYDQISSKINVFHYI